MRPIKDCNLSGSKYFGLNEGNTIKSEALTIKKADGVFLWAKQGKKYLDLFSQTWSMPLGHNNKKVNNAVKKQINKITHLRTAFFTENKSALAKKLFELAPTGLTKVNFVLHGSLAVEGAMKLAINNYENRQKILYLEDGFHGRSFATMGISWKMPGCKYSDYFSNGIEVKKNLADIEGKMKSENPAAIIIELVQGNGGCKILGKDFVRGIRELCNANDVTMIIDEVQTAFGCIGKMFLCENYNVVPDILVFGKALGGGYPLAGALFKNKYHLQSGDHSFTFAHCPISMAAGLAYLKELELVLKEKPVEAISKEIESSLLILEKKYKNLRGTRCIGTKGAIDVLDNEGNPDTKTADLIVAKMLQKGVIIANSKCRELGNTIMLQSPIIITPEQLKSAFCTFDSVLNEIYGQRCKIGQ
jgi:4-aminobutyrate aminotransferase-like enzyme